jgi:hypothetical protein
MALPETIRVKLSSEAAESIALTPVVVQEMAIRDLIEHVLGVTGKDEPRIRDLLLRGTLVSGASRFRWTGWDVETEGLSVLLATFPDPEPHRAFAPTACIRAILRGGRQAIDITRDAGDRKGMFQHHSFWDDLMSIAGAANPAYLGYSYRDHADRYQRDFTHAETGRLREVCSGLRYSTLRDQVRTVAFTHAELLAKR